MTSIIVLAIILIIYIFSIIGQFFCLYFGLKYFKPAWFTDSALLQSDINHLKQMNVSLNERVQSLEQEKNALISKIIDLLAV